MTRSPSPTAMSATSMFARRAHFDELHAGADDPWGYEHRWFERRRFSLIMAMLDDQIYDEGYEPGCSSGVLTSHLAPRCKSLLATDWSAAAIRQAKTRTRPFVNVELHVAATPDEWPDRAFDLIVLSDFCYYLQPDAVTDLADRAFASLRPNGTLLACHWLGVADDFLTPARSVHEILRRSADHDPFASYSDADQIIDVWRTPPAADATDPRHGWA